MLLLSSHTTYGDLCIAKCIETRYAFLLFSRFIAVLNLENLMVNDACVNFLLLKSEESNVARHFVKSKPARITFFWSPQ